MQKYSVSKSPILKISYQIIISYFQKCIQTQLYNVNNKKNILTNKQVRFTILKEKYKHYNLLFI